MDTRLSFEIHAMDIYTKKTVFSRLFSMKPMTKRCLNVFLSALISGVVSVSFEEDEEGNLCLIAYPLHSDPASDLENKEHQADCEPKVLQWGKMLASPLLVDSENYSKDGRSRHSRKDKDKR